MTSSVKLGTAFDKENDDEIILQGKPTPRPRDAATLILVKKDAHATRVLMGKRSAGHDFMPKKYVFPGGRVDPPDGRVPASTELDTRQEHRLRYKSRRQPRAFALTAIRETFEETGLVVGRSSTDMVRTTNNSWSQYFSHGVIPPLEDMDFIARAITPPYRSRRFDTRFFMVHDSTIQSDPSQVSSASGELLDLHWLTLDEARQTDLPAITRMVIDVVEERLKIPKSQQQAEPAPFVRNAKSKWLTSNL